MTFRESWEPSEIERLESLTGVRSFVLEPAWANAARESSYGEPVSLARQRGGQISAVALGIRRRRMGFSKILCGSNGGVGVLGEDPASASELLAELRRRWRPSVCEVFATENLAATGFQWTPAYTIQLDLHEPLRELRENLEKRTRNALSRGERAGVRIATAAANEVSPAYELLEATAESKGFRLPPRSFSLELHKQYGSAGLSEIVLARRDSELLAMVHVLGARGVASWWKGGATEAGYGLNAPVCAQWHAIELARERGFLTYDFGGTHPSDSRYAAIHKYKSGFGGQLVPLALGRHHTLPARAAGIFRQS